jgi:hypothetical protein
MEVHFKPEVQAKLEQMAQQAGCASEDLVEDAVTVYVDELACAREMLDQRYDDLETGKVEMIDGEEAFRRLMSRTETERQRRRTG